MFTRTSITKSYSSYCFFFGFTIKPYDPQDSIDAACMTHDKCWDEISNEKKCAYGIWEHYVWQLAEGEV